MKQWGKFLLLLFFVLLTGCGGSNDKEKGDGIPANSMGPTVVGYHATGTCPKCGYYFPINASNEIEEQDGVQQQRLIGCKCPNCSHPILGKEFERFQGKIP